MDRDHAPDPAAFGCDFGRGNDEHVHGVYVPAGALKPGRVIPLGKLPPDMTLKAAALTGRQFGKTTMLMSLAKKPEPQGVKVPVVAVACFLSLCLGAGIAITILEAIHR